MSDQPIIPILSLTHGQVLQTIEAMHIAEWLDRSSLDAVLKKLRRDFVPFTAEELDKPQWEQLRYSYVHLIECVVAIKICLTCKTSDQEIAEDALLEVI